MAAIPFVMFMAVGRLATGSGSSGSGPDVAVATPTSATGDRCRPRGNARSRAAGRSGTRGPRSALRDVVHEVRHAVAADDLRRIVEKDRIGEGPVAKNGRPEPNTAGTRLWERIAQVLPVRQRRSHWPGRKPLDDVRAVPQSRRRVRQGGARALIGWSGRAGANRHCSGSGGRRALGGDRRALAGGRAW